MYRNDNIFYRILDSFFRYRWLFFGTVASIIAVALAAGFLRPRTYSASAALQVVSQDTASTLGIRTDDSSYVSPAQRSVQRFHDMMSDDQPGGFIDTALHNAQLSRPINIDPAAADPRFALLKKRISMDTVSDTIFAVSLTWDDAGECKRILESLREQFRDRTGTNEQEKSSATASFLDSEIKSYEKRLQQAEQALENYKTANLGALPDSQTATMGQLGELKTKLNDLKITAQNGELKRQALARRLAEVKPMDVKEQTVGPDVDSQLKQLQLQRSVLLTRYMPEHPQIQALNTEISVLQRTRAQEQRTNAGAPANVKETKLQQNPEYQALEEQLTQARIDQTTQQAEMQLLLQQIARYEAALQRMPAQDRELTEKTRDYTVLKTQYEDLLARREEARMKANLAQASAVSTLRPIGTVYPESSFSSKKLGLTLGIGALLGLVFGAVMVILREWLDPSLRYETDAARLLSLPVLASVPDSDGLRPYTLNGSPAVAIAEPGARDGGWPFDMDLDEGDTLFRLDPTSKQPISATPDAVEVFTHNTLPEFAHLFASLERQVARKTGDMVAEGDAGTEGAFVLGVTSAIVGEGKTTVALNLAINAARTSYKKVCLIDLSLSDMDLGRHLGVLSQKSGIIKILEATEGAPPTLRLSGLEDLSTAASGRITVDASRLARSPRIAEVIAKARKSFGLVIVDLPAAVTDNVLPISRHMDGLVVVACAGATPKNVINHAVDQLGREKVIGVVVNRIRSSSPEWLQKRFKAA